MRFLTFAEPSSYQNSGYLAMPQLSAVLYSVNLEECYNVCINQRGLCYLYLINYLTLQFDVNNSQLHTAANTLMSIRFLILAECISPNMCYLIKILLPTVNNKYEYMCTKYIAFCYQVNNTVRQFDKYSLLSHLTYRNGRRSEINLIANTGTS